MFIKKKSISLFFCLFTLLIAQAQQPTCSLTIKGSVSLSDSATSNLSAVSVYVQQSSQQVAVDSNGNFIISHFCPGKFTIRISYVGYRSIDTTLNVSTSMV